MGVVDEVVGAGIFGFLAGESFLESGEAGPGVSTGRTLRGDAPKIEGLELFFLGIQDKLDGKDAGGMESAAFI